MSINFFVMRELFHRIATRANWFLGFVIFCLALGFFLYAAIDPDGFQRAVQTFWQTLMCLLQYVLFFGIALLGFRMLWRGLLGGGRSRRGGNHG